jgi:hypothetical protein
MVFHTCRTDLGELSSTMNDTDVLLDINKVMILEWTVLLENRI